MAPGAGPRGSGGVNTVAASADFAVVGVVVAVVVDVEDHATVVVVDVIVLAVDAAITTAVVDGDERTGQTIEVSVVVGFKGTDARVGWSAVDGAIGVPDVTAVDAETTDGLVMPTSAACVV